MTNDLELAIRLFVPDGHSTLIKDKSSAAYLILNSN